MKFNVISVSSIVGGITLTTALGIEPPPENVEPPSAILEQGANNEGKKEENGPRMNEELSIPFIGLSTAPLPAMVADHVGLDPNSAVIVRMVMPESPAEKAGISANDIVLKVDELVVTQPEQLSAAILSRKIGERVDLSLIHKGKAAKVTVTLGERPAGLAMNPAPGPMLDGLPQEHAERLRGLIERNLQEFGGNANLADMDAPFRQLREQMNRAMDESIRQVPQEGEGGFEFQQNSTVRMMDEQGMVEIKSSNGGTIVTVRDKTGGVSWAGPWDTAQDKASAPDDIRERIEKIHSGKGNGFRFHFRKRQLDEPDTIDN